MNSNQTAPRPLPTTQAEIARLAGCTRQTVAKWQRGGEVLATIEAAIVRAIRAVEAGQSVIDAEMKSA